MLQTLSWPYTVDDFSGLPQFFLRQNTRLLQDFLPKIQPSSERNTRLLQNIAWFFSLKIQGFYRTRIKIIILLPNFYDPIVHRTVKYKSFKKTVKYKTFTDCGNPDYTYHGGKSSTPKLLCVTQALGFSCEMCNSPIYNQ